MQLTRRYPWFWPGFLILVASPAPLYLMLVMSLFW